MKQDPDSRTQKISSLLAQLIKCPDPIFSSVIAACKAAIYEVRFMRLPIHWLPKWGHLKTASRDEQGRTACGRYIMGGRYVQRCRGEGTTEKHKVTCKNCLRSIRAQ